MPKIPSAMQRRMARGGSATPRRPRTDSSTAIRIRNENVVRLCASIIGAMKPTARPAIFKRPVKTALPIDAEIPQNRAAEATHR